MDLLHTIMTLAALAGLGLAVGLQLRRSRRESRFMSSAQRGGLGFRSW